MQSQDADKADKKLVTELLDYEVGMSIDGEKIKKVFYQSKHCIMFEVDDSFEMNYRYHANHYSNEVQAAISQVEQLYADAQEKLQGTYNHTLTTKFIALILQLLTPDAPIENFSTNDFETFVENLKPIKSLIGAGRGFDVWINGKGDVEYTVFNSVKNKSDGKVAFTRLKSLAAIKLKGKQLEVFHSKLGAALVCCFESKTNNTKEIFEVEENYLNSLVANRIRILYLIAVTFSTTTLTLFLFLIYNFHTGIVLPKVLLTSLIPVSAGFLGAYISLFERFKTIEINENDSLYFLAIQAILRVLLGGLFGFVAYIAAVSDLAFGFLKNGHSSLFILGLIGGFSERVIPDLIEGFAASKTDFK